MDITEPLKCTRVDDLDEIPLPTLATPKVDGMRAIVLDGEVLTRSFKRLQNFHIRKHLAGLPNGTDGEIVCGSFSATQSACMRREGEPWFRYYVFDVASPEPYYIRSSTGLPPPSDWLQPLYSCPCSTLHELTVYVHECLQAGYEGVVCRRPDSAYYCGRSPDVFKWKPLLDGEAIVLGTDEAMRNDNPQVPGAFGRMRRPGGYGGPGGKSPKGTLGSLRVKDVRTSVEFSIGTGRGLTKEVRQRLWDERHTLVGLLVTYSYQEMGSRGRPRFPRLKGFRSLDDMDSDACEAMRRRAQEDMHEHGS
jgi:DNA ligase 1